MNDCYWGTLYSLLYLGQFFYRMGMLHKLLTFKGFSVLSQSEKEKMHRTEIQNTSLLTIKTISFDTLYDISDVILWRHTGTSNHDGILWRQIVTAYCDVILWRVKLFLHIWMLGNTFYLANGSSMTSLTCLRIVKRINFDRKNIYKESTQKYVL